MALRYSEKLDAHGNLDASNVFVTGRFQTGEVRVTVPVAATATVVLPITDPNRVSEGDKQAARVDGVKLAGSGGGTARFEVGSGDHTFRVAKGASG